MAVAHHLLPQMQLGEGALYACFLILAFLVGTRAYGGVRHSRDNRERLLIVGTSSLTRRVIEEKTVRIIVSGHRSIPDQIEEASAEAVETNRESA
jgi:hypothetical protein